MSQRWDSWMNTNVSNRDTYMDLRDRENALSTIVAIITKGLSKKFKTAVAVTGFAKGLFEVLRGDTIDMIYYTTYTYYRSNLNDRSEYQKKNVTLFFDDKRRRNLIDTSVVIETRSDD